MFRKNKKSGGTKGKKGADKDKDKEGGSRSATPSVEKAEKSADSPAPSTRETRPKLRG